MASDRRAQKSEKEDAPIPNCWSGQEEHPQRHRSPLVPSPSLLNPATAAGSSMAPCSSPALFHSCLVAPFCLRFRHSKVNKDSLKLPTQLGKTSLAMSGAEGQLEKVEWAAGRE